ncbi:MaoC family dehydratase N-terminal domain-containing protein [Ornithinimicrobium faecis]|uniref:MaoC family dehydratase N-terminal domain-containing protein n=1 Tax=Ornithinimicrobium faecis TaxID=2934158 RepID=A0ABY4YXP2_9MICO|nr:MaoC/PaaZ C-terminal domain-containing protein [Ornithinimicrobium sp. HY1793]USQ80877.1 MaoC family dehydratase N-terminal domain-containing protein [Ornithinimicrobium sp. HY1793]
MTQTTTDPAALSRTVTVDRALLVDYANASGDQNPIHQDADFARSVGLEDVIAHGMWTMGAALDVVTAYVGGDPGRVLSCSTRFTGMVVVPEGETVEVLVEGVIKKSDEEAGTQTVELTATCAGEKVLGRCLAVVRA